MPDSASESSTGKTRAKKFEKKIKDLQFSRKNSSHPKTAEMVNAAITDLKERNGSSLYAIKKYVAANYKVDAEKMAPFIKKYLKSAVSSGSIIQTKGMGASGSFKLAKVDNMAKAKMGKAKKELEKTEPNITKKLTAKKEKISSPSKGTAKEKPEKSIVETEKAQNSPKKNTMKGKLETDRKEPTSPTEKDKKADEKEFVSSLEKPNSKSSRTAMANPKDKNTGKSPMKKPKAPKPKKTTNTGSPKRAAL